jgi:glycosyltransferase 2 family protein
MRKVFIWLAFLLAAVLVLFSLREIEQTIETLQRARLEFILVAVILQLGFMFSETVGYCLLYRLMDLRESFRRLGLLVVGSNFLNIVAPSAGASGIAVFVDDARRRNLSPGRTAAATALYLFLDYAAFMVALSLGLLVLFRRGNLDAGEIGASALMTLLCLGFGTLLYIGSHSGARLGKILARLARLANKILRPFYRRDYVRESRAYEFSHEIADGLSVLRNRRRRLFKPFAFALLGKTLHALLLMFVFLGFGVDFSAGTVIGGFAISYLFLIISPTPSGIGVVETILPLALVSLRVPWTEAVVVTLTYRALTFWLPLALGAVAFRVLQRE